MAEEINIRIIVEAPPVGVDFGLQKGKGSKYETVQKLRSTTKDLCFELKIEVKQQQAMVPDFRGPFVHGPVIERFIYLDIGVCAGQLDSMWTRRLKVPLRGITADMVNSLVADPAAFLETKVPGTAKDGGPNCATVKPFPGWRMAKR